MPFDPIFKAAPRPVRPEWIDYNGHLNMAYYSVLMDEGLDELYPKIGFGLDYLQTTGCTTYVAEFHICYIREVHEGDLVSSHFRLLDYDTKRFHGYQELWHADGWLAATGEALTLHVDQSGPRVAPMPAEILANMEAMKAAQADLDWPERAGRKIGMKR